jgi:hypothetical protein
MSDENLTKNLQETGDTVDTDAIPLTTPKKKRGRPCGASLANLRPFDSERAKAISAKANAAKAARQEMRRRILAAVCEAGVDKYVAKALKEQNPELMSICEKAISMTGLHYKESEENIQNLHVTAETNNKTDATIKFVIEDV